MPPNLDRMDPRRSEPPEEGSELYRHRNADNLRTRGWHGYYRARRTTGGQYEIRRTPASLGEPSTPGGVVPGEPFERLYQKVDRV
ncbi:MAG TPA: hypothetical protein VGR18_11805 [Rubrobacter sp.]|nr:hypothetical protein [Rubrobacter sp.]